MRFTMMIACSLGCRAVCGQLPPAQPVKCGAIGTKDTKPITIATGISVCSVVPKALNTTAKATAAAVPSTSPSSAWPRGDPQVGADLRTNLPRSLRR